MFDALTDRFTKLQRRLRGFGTLTAVRLNGEEVEAETWEDACSTYLGVEVEPTPGRERTLTVTL